jgi:hypothetical protein
MATVFREIAFATIACSAARPSVSAAGPNAGAKTEPGWRLACYFPENPMRSYQLAQELSHTFEAMLALFQKECKWTIVKNGLGV